MTHTISLCHLCLFLSSPFYTMRMIFTSPKGGQLGVSHRPSELPGNPSFGICLLFPFHIPAQDQGLYSPCQKRGRGTLFFIRRREEEEDKVPLSQLCFIYSFLQKSPTPSLQIAITGPFFSFSYQEGNKKRIAFSKTSEVIRLWLWKGGVLRHSGSQARGRLPPGYGTPAPREGSDSYVWGRGLPMQLFALGKQLAL